MNQINLSKMINHLLKENVNENLEEFDLQKGTTKAGLNLAKKSTGVSDIEKAISPRVASLRNVVDATKLAEMLAMIINKIQSLNNASLTDQEIAAALTRLKNQYAIKGEK
jgi:hypothetical protein